MDLPCLGIQNISGISHARIIERAKSLKNGKTTLYRAFLHSGKGELNPCPPTADMNPTKYKKRKRPPSRPLHVAGMGVEPMAFGL
jgi:hypothetical protein